MRTPRSSRVRVATAALACSAALCVVPVGCVDSQDQVLASQESQVRLRSIQTRAFDGTDRNKMHRAVIATLQDLGFVIDSADESLGTVTATKVDGSAGRVTVTIRARGSTQLLVRASAQQGLHAVEEPGPYQRFFEALAKAIFLTAHEVD